LFLVFFRPVLVVFYFPSSVRVFSSPFFFPPCRDSVAAHQPFFPDPIFFDRFYRSRTSPLNPLIRIRKALGFFCLVFVCDLCDRPGRDVTHVKAFFFLRAWVAFGVSAIRPGGAFFICADVNATTLRSFPAFRFPLRASRFSVTQQFLRQWFVEFPLLCELRFSHARLPGPFHCP